MAKSKYESHVAPRFADVRQWRRDGLSEKQVAHNLGVSKTSLEVYKREHPDFLALLKDSRKPIVAESFNNLVKRMRGYDYDEIKTYIREELGEPAEGKETVLRRTRYTERAKKHIPPHVGACMCILNNEGGWSDNPAMMTLRRELLEFEKQKLAEMQW